jgi:DNA recombination protein RmuC
MQPELVILLAVLALGLTIIALLAVALRRIGPQGVAATAARFDEIQRSQDRTERVLTTEIARNREESGAQSKQLREEVGNTLTSASSALTASVAELSQLQTAQLSSFAAQLAKLTQSNEEKLERVRNTVEERLTVLQFENASKLDAIRVTVDEKLQGTLEAKLGESFRLVSEHLEQVHKGLGEMQTLASGVGDLKKVLSNVKTRGTWGEIQLRQLLDQVLVPDQYAANVVTREGSDERVEFAIKLPGRGADDTPVLLPIDAKFPLEDYQRLVDSADRADADAVEVAARQLEASVKVCARDIRDKYLNPPRTTDFGILFLPVEGLCAEVLRRAGLVDQLQRDFHVVPCGPTTLWALLNSLQMGFRTLAIERRSSEVWTLLGAVKAEFAKFGEALDAVQKKLGEASDKIDAARKGTRKIQRKLQDVQELPAAEAASLVAAAVDDGDEGSQDLR